MTENNFKKYLIAVLAIGIIGSMAIYLPNVHANTETKGETTVLSDVPQSNDPNLLRAIQINKELENEDITDTEKMRLHQEHQSLKENYLSNLDVSKQEKGLAKKQLLSQLMVEKSINGDDSVPIIALSVDPVTSDLLVGVKESRLAEDEQKVIEFVRNVVGEDINIKIYPEKEAFFLSCSQAGECEPAQGGVKIATFTNGCSVGFKASYGGDDGFVTAGHCSNGSSSGTVGQPNYLPWDHIGTITDNTWVNGTTFDGMFVHADDGETISDKVFNGVDVNVASLAQYLDGVTGKGHTTGTLSGTVLNASYDREVQGVWLLDHAYTSMVADDGDSGGTVYESIPVLGFVGIMSASDKETFTLVSKQENAASSGMPGLTWDFS